MTKDDESLRLIHIENQGCILVAKWVIRCLEGCAPWSMFLIHLHLIDQPSGRSKGSFQLCDIISSPHSFQVVGSSLL